MTYVIALDVGGTGMKGALVARDGTLLKEERRATGRAAGPEAVVAGILDFAADLARPGEPPAAAGVVVPGIVDEARGTAVYAANLGWRDVPLRALLAERLGVPVALAHDVRAGALAEGRLGAGRGVARFLFVALGTGIAGGIAIDGRIEPGAHGSAGEIGHVVVRPGGRTCGCGARGCLETVSSASAVARAWAEAEGTDDAADCARAVRDGNPAAQAVWSEAVAALADGLTIAQSLLDPAAVILGGGLAEAGSTLLTPLRTALAARLTFQTAPTLVPAELKDTAGCLGAALLAWDLTTTTKETL